MTDKKLYNYLVSIITLAFLLSGYLLENMGIKYISEGGSPLFKIHVYSYLIFFTFFILVISGRYKTHFTLLSKINKAWMTSVILVSLSIVYGLYKQGTSGMAYFIDTIMSPIILVFLLSALSRERADKLLTFVAWLLLLNSSIAICEFMLNKTLVPVEYENFTFFRSTALLNHALNNALITAALSPILMNKTRVPALIYFAISFLALFCYGGRGAMGLYLICTVFISMGTLKMFVTTGIKIDKLKFSLYQASFVVLILLLALILINTEMGSRILSKLHVDNSAQVRFDVFILLEQLTITEWLFGASDYLMSSVKFFIGVGTIENYFIGWILSGGVIFASMIFISCFHIPFKIASSKSLLMKVSLFSFVLISLTNNALTTKTPALLLLYCVLYCNYIVVNRKKI